MEHKLIDSYELNRDELMLELSIKESVTVGDNSYFENGSIKGFDEEKTDGHPEFYIDKWVEMSNIWNQTTVNERTEILNKFYKEVIFISEPLKKNLKIMFPNESKMISLCKRDNIHHQSYVTSLMKECCGQSWLLLIAMCTSVSVKVLDKYKKHLVRRELANGARKN